MIGFCAPGKVVIWGEYAVLAGAPALVMAVDRYASCSIEAHPAGWRCEAVGFAGQEDLAPADLLSGAVDENGPGAVIAAAVRAIAPDVLRHRLGLSYEAQGEGISADDVVSELLRQVALP